MTEELTLEQKLEEIRRHLIEEIEFCESQMTKPGVDHHFYFMRQCYAIDTLGYLTYLEGNKSKDNELLFAILGSPKEMRDKYYTEHDKQIRNDTLSNIVESIKHLNILIENEQMKKGLVGRIFTAPFVRGAKTAIGGMIAIIEQLKDKQTN